MKAFTCSFFGHRDFRGSSEHYSKLYSLVKELLQKHEYVDFLIGGNGEFDRFAASVVHSFKGENCSLTLVLPYLTADFSRNMAAYENYYDNIEIYERSACAHFKGAIGICNRYIADRSDLIICCIERDNGGAYSAVRYAVKSGKPVINLSE